MSEPKFYTDRSNARRAAERMIEKGEAPSIDYGIKPNGDGKFEIVWHTSKPASDATPEPAGAAEQASQDATALKAEPDSEPAIETDPGFAPAGDPSAEPAPIVEPEARPAIQEPAAEADVQPSPRAQAMADKLNAEAAQLSNPKSAAVLFGEWYNGQVVEAQHATKPGKFKPTTIDPAAALEGAKAFGEFTTQPFDHNGRNFLTLEFADGSRMGIANDEGPKPEPKRELRAIGPTTAAKSAAGFTPTDKDAEQQAEPAPKAARAASRPAATTPTPKAETRAPRAAPLAAGPDGLPTKPVITSAANASYQAKFDALEGMAKAGNWDGVEAYQVKGVNTYAKKLASYRAALLAARPAAKTTAA